ETTLDTIPDDVPYLGVNDPSDIIDIGRSDKFKVGFVWAGDPTQENNRNRSVDVAHFARLVDVPGTQFFSLQVGAAESDLSATDFAGNVTALGPKLSDYNLTASAINQLDLVISVCTSVTHLAGAMAKPVWTLLSFAPDFRWLLDREDSPWYPTMRLYRQPKMGDWEAVFTEVSRELKKLVSGAK
ncbi:MAG: TIGR03032 family protein, partial [Deltaproteobacteria bacterium]|nr:TIGR03032 family protein [Deltaproteobacteria bacterium]